MSLDYVPTEEARRIRRRLRRRSERKYRYTLIGRRFGRLVVVSRWASRLWVCRCDCGATSYVLTGNLTSGNSKSCGNHSRVSREHRLKISKALTGRIVSKATRAKLAAAACGKHRSLRTRFRISFALAGRPGHPMSRAHKAKLSALFTGKPLGKAHKAKLRAAARKRTHAFRW